MAAGTAAHGAGVTVMHFMTTGAIECAARLNIVPIDVLDLHERAAP